MHGIHNILIISIFPPPRAGVTASKRETKTLEKAWKSILLERGKNFSDKTVVHIRTLFNRFGYEEIFGRSAVVELLEIRNSSASKFLSKLVWAEIIEPVSGHGKGKYKFRRWLRSFSRIISSYTLWMGGLMPGRFCFLQAFLWLGMQPYDKKSSESSLLFNGDGGIRTLVPVTRQLDFESSSLWPLRYVSIGAANEQNENRFVVCYILNHFL